MRSRWPSLPFGRRLVGALLVVAVIPLWLFGAFAVSQIETSLGSSSEARVQDVLGAVDSVLARRQGELSETTRGYAGWSVTRALIDAGDSQGLREGVLDFLERRGSVSVAVALIDGSILTGRSDALANRIVAAVGPPQTDDQRIVAAGDDLYQVAVVAVASPQVQAGASDPPPVPDQRVAPGRTMKGDWMIFARRLDGEFAHEIRRLTGFDIAVVHGGQVAVAGDPRAAALFIGEVGPTAGNGRHDGFVAGWVPVGEDGLVVGSLVVTSRQDAIQALLAGLPGVLAISLAVAALLSITAAWLLGRSLNRRLSAIHDGLAAMAVGRRPRPRVSSVEPDVERLAVALDGRVAATDRRERILQRASSLVADLRPESGVEAVSVAAAIGTRTIFQLESATLSRADDSVIASYPPDTDIADEDRSGAGRRIEAPLGATDGSDGWLIGVAVDQAVWSEADDALFAICARLIGGVLRDAHVHDATSGRLVRMGRLNALQREFLRSVSHNLKTPLTTIALLADDLADPPASRTAEFSETRIRTIRAEAARLERLVGQVLTVSQLDAGNMQLDRDAVALAPAIRRVWASLGSDRVFEFDDRAPGLMALGDRDAIEQVLWIILDNALRYAPDGPVRVTTRASAGADLAIDIEIADAGPGIPEAERRHIFRRFWSGAAGRQRGGTGIGLDIARRLARAMTGTVSYRAGSPGGSIFVLTLPAESASED